VTPGSPVPELDTETGNVGVPAGTPEGTYTIVYKICAIYGGGSKALDGGFVDGIDSLARQVTICDEATITIVVVNDAEGEEPVEGEGIAAIDLTKTAEPATYSAVGDVITYTITVTNTGDITLRNVRVTDEMVGLEEVVSEMVPGENKVFTVEYSITEADLATGEIVNIARAVSETLDDEVEDEGTATVTLDDEEQGGCKGFDWGPGTLFTTILAFLAMLFSSLFGGGNIRPPKV